MPPCSTFGSSASTPLAGSAPEGERLYGSMIATLRREVEKIETERGMEPHEVAAVIGKALTASRPRTRYLVGSDAKLRGRMAKVVPDRVMDRLVARAFR